MQGVAKRSERGFLKRLSLRRVGVNGRRDVLKPRAHFKRKPERRGKLRNAAAHRLNAEHKVVVLARGNADEAFLCLHRHGAAVCGEGEHLRDDLMTGGFRLLRRETRRDDFRIGEADRRDRDLVP